METIEYSALKHNIVPRIQALCVVQGGDAIVRIAALVCLGKLMAVMDKWLVQDTMFPLLEKMTARDPGTLMGMLGIVSEVS